MLSFSLSLTSFFFFFSSPLSPEFQTLLPESSSFFLKKYHFRSSFSEGSFLIKSVLVVTNAVNFALIQIKTIIFLGILE